MASTLAGNLTITGSVANIIVVETAKPDVHIGFWDYFRVGFPITLPYYSIWVGLGCACTLSWRSAVEVPP